MAGPPPTSFDTADFVPTDDAVTLEDGLPSKTPPLTALATRLAETPEAPWLFMPEDATRWRWRSWRAVALRARAAAAQLAPDAPDISDRLRDATQLVVDSTLDFDGAAALLAVWLLGRTAVPVPGNSQLAPWDLASVPRLPLTDDVGPFDAFEPSSAPAATLDLTAARRAATIVDGCIVPLATLERAALANLPSREEAVPARRRWFGLLPPRAQRPIALCAGSFADAAVLRLLLWSVQVDATLVLVPPTWDWLHAALWVRPTVVLAEADDALALAQALALPRHRRAMRLRHVILRADRLDEADRTSWIDFDVSLHLSPLD
ncbi:MAG: hypothetical protein AAF772_07610 [Acidobacteriota bacterium]